MNFYQVKFWYKLNYYLGVTSFILYFLISLLWSTYNFLLESFFEKVEIDFHRPHFLSYNPYPGRAHADAITRSAVFPYIFIIGFIFFFLKMRKSKNEIGNNFNSASQINKTTAVLQNGVVCFLAMNFFDFFYFQTVYINKTDLTWYKMECIKVLNLVIAAFIPTVILLSTGIQKLIVKYIEVYASIYLLSILFPLILLFFSSDSFFDHQYYIYVYSRYNSGSISLSKDLMRLLIFSPYNIINLPLFFTITHYLLTRKLVSVNPLYSNESLEINWGNRFKYGVLFYVVILSIIMIRGILKSLNEMGYG